MQPCAEVTRDIRQVDYTLKMAKDGGALGRTQFFAQAFQPL
jgi:hypothetical protein